MRWRGFLGIPENPKTAKALRYTSISKYCGIKIATVLYSSISFNNIDTDFSVYRQQYGAVFGIYINHVRKKKLLFSMFVSNIVVSCISCILLLFFTVFVVLMEEAGDNDEDMGVESRTVDASEELVSKPGAKSQVWQYFG